MKHHFLAPWGSLFYSVAFTPSASQKARQLPPKGAEGNTTQQNKVFSQAYLPCRGGYVAAGGGISTLRFSIVSYST